MVGKPAATPMTSSPGLMARSPSLGEVRVLKATRLADEPELTVMRCLTPRNAASCFSKSSLKRPVVSQPSSEASTMFLSSSAPMTFARGRHHGSARAETAAEPRRWRRILRRAWRSGAQGLGSCCSSHGCACHWCFMILVGLSVLCDMVLRSGASVNLLHSPRLSCWRSSTNPRSVRGPVPGSSAGCQFRRLRALEMSSFR